MWAQNTSQSNHSIVIDDATVFEMIPVMRTDFSSVLEISSVVFDLMAALLATFFTFRFYKHIEISHPLYAIIFMDIVISTATSYLVFILFLVNSQVNSDVITILEYDVNAISVFNNVSSFMMIAFIRYYLLVLTKTNKNEGEIDMMKVKNISLIMNCIVFVIIFLIRGGLCTARLVGYNVKLEMLSSGLCLSILPLIITLILNRKIDIFLKSEHDPNDLNANNRSTQPGEDQFPRPHSHSLRDRRGNDGKRERLNPRIPDIESNCSSVIERGGTSIAYSRYAGDCNTEAVSSISHYIDGENQKYGGIYVGETSISSPNATNINENEVISSTKNVDMLPNQVNIESEDSIHIIESKHSSEAKTVSLHHNCNIEHRKNSYLINTNTQNDTANVDENRIEVLETIDDESTNSPSPNMSFPSDREGNTTYETEDYNESREHKSILKCVMITSLFLLILTLTITFIRFLKGFNLDTITKIILFMVFTILVKLCRTFMVIFSSIYCFELVRSLFMIITNDTVEFFQSAYDRFIAYF